MTCCAPKRSQIFAETRRFVFGAIRFVHHDDPCHRFAGDERESLMEPERPLIRRKFQKQAAETKQFQDAITHLPLGEHWPEKPLNQRRHEHTGKNSDIDSDDRLERYRPLSVQPDCAYDRKEGNLHAKINARYRLAEIPE